MPVDSAVFLGMICLVFCTFVANFMHRVYTWKPPVSLDGVVNLVGCWPTAGSTSGLATHSKFFMRFFK